MSTVCFKYFIVLQVFKAHNDRCVADTVLEVRYWNRPEVQT